MNNSTAPTELPPLEDLARHWVEAKTAEDLAKSLRLSVESAICASLNVAPGSTQTIHLLPGFRVRYDINRTVDTDALRAAWATLPEVAQNCVRWKAEVSATQYNAAADLLPEAVAQLNAFITTKPAKPSFTFIPPKETPNGV